MHLNFGKLKSRAKVKIITLLKFNKTIFVE